MVSLQQIEDAVMQLSDKERARLAARLLHSLPQELEGADDDELMAEAKRRERQIQQGLATPGDWTVLMKELRKDGR